MPVGQMEHREQLEAEGHDQKAEPSRGAKPQMGAEQPVMKRPPPFEGKVQTHQHARGTGQHEVEDGGGASGGHVRPRVRADERGADVEGEQQNAREGEDGKAADEDRVGRQEAGRKARKAGGEDGVLNVSQPFAEQVPVLQHDGHQLVHRAHGDHRGPAEHQEVRPRPSRRHPRIFRERRQP